MKTAYDSKRTKRVLVVEDDPDLCRLISRSALNGPIPLELRFASTVHQATAILDSNGPFDLVLADFLLADAHSGLELLEVCGDDVTTGGFAMMSSMPLEVSDLEPCAFLRKPFSIEECREFLTERVSGGPS